MVLLADRWTLNSGNKSKKGHVLQILYHPGNGMGGVNSAFRAGKNLSLNAANGIWGKTGGSYVKALFSFKNVKSLEAAIRNIKRKNKTIRIFRARWTEIVEGKLIGHIIIKKGKIQTKYKKQWEKIS